MKLKPYGLCEEDDDVYEYAFTTRYGPLTPGSFFAFHRPKTFDSVQPWLPKINEDRMVEAGLKRIAVLPEAQRPMKRFPRLWDCSLDDYIRSKYNVKTVSLNYWNYIKYGDTDVVAYLDSELRDRVQYGDLVRCDNYRATWTYLVTKSGTVMLEGEGGGHRYLPAAVMQDALESGFDFQELVDFYNSGSILCRLPFYGLIYAFGDCSYDYAGRQTEYDGKWDYIDENASPAWAFMLMHGLPHEVQVFYDHLRSSDLLDFALKAAEDEEVENLPRRLQSIYHAAQKVARAAERAYVDPAYKWCRYRLLRNTPEFAEGMPATLREYIRTN